MNDQFDNIPQVLKDLPQWVVWTDRDEKGNPTKRPLQVSNGWPASPTNRQHWSDFDSAVECAATYPDRVAGIGLVLFNDGTPGPKPVCIDIDDPVKRGFSQENIDRIRRLGNNVLNDMDSYTEISPSGDGLHILVMAEIPPEGVKSSQDCIEIYSHARFITFTGRSFDQQPLPMRYRPEARIIYDSLAKLSKPLADIVEREWSEPVGEIIERIKGWQNGAEFSRLFNMPIDEPGTDNSGIDQALMNFLWKATQNVAACKALFLMSERGKRDKAKREDYLDRTIRRAADKIGDAPLVNIEKLLDAGWSALRGEHVGKYSTADCYPILFDKDMSSLPPRKWRIKGLLPEQGLFTIHSPPATGKTFLAMDLAYSIANSETWFGHKVVNAPVLVIGLEGESGYNDRKNALKIGKGKSGETLSNNFGFMLGEDFDITNRAHIDRLIASIPDGCVVIIDTLNQAAPMIDENTSQGMGAVISAAKRIYRERKALVGLIHHSAKSANGTLRGHGSLLGAVDAAIFVGVTENGEKYWTPVKVKDGEQGRKFGFNLKQAKVGVDADGDAITSCFVEQIELKTKDDVDPKPESESKTFYDNLSPNGLLAMAALQNAGTKLQNPQGAVSLDAWRAEFIDVYKGSKDSAIRKFRELPDYLTNKGAVVEIAGTQTYVHRFAYENANRIAPNTS